MANHIIIERLLSLIIEDDMGLYGIRPKHNDEGYFHLKVPPSYYGVSVLLFITFGMFRSILFYAPMEQSKSEIWLVVPIPVFFLSVTVLSFLYVKNTCFRFTEKEIIGQDLFKRRKSHILE